MRALLLLAALLLLPTALRAQAAAEEDELPRVLFLTHSAGFEHGVVTRPDPLALSHAEERLVQAARGRFRVTATQSCDELLPERLAGYDAVVFYTTGELPIPDAARAGLLDWIAAGGAFVGVHCATDTFYDYPLYQEMLGGVFDGHPWHDEVEVRVEEGSHPATDHLQGAFEIEDEIYQFRGFRRHPARVLLALDTDSVDASLGKRADGDYALAWWKDWGEGRVFYTALGHDDEVWRDRRFLDHLLDGIGWAIDGPDLPAPSPTGAIELLPGGDLSAWARRGGGEAGWRPVGEGAVEVVPGAGDVVTRQDFGDALIHVEFRTPLMPDARGQARGNSGVYVQGRYEVQVLDSHGLVPGLDDCGSIYGKKAPDANASRPPERWQVYDVEFTAPRFDAAGVKTAEARMTVWHNGRRIHDDAQVDGITRGGLDEPEAPLGPLLLQDHGDPVRYRNVWILPR